jgi:hypothetical protein
MDKKGPRAIRGLWVIWRTGSVRIDLTFIPQRGCAPVVEARNWPNRKGNAGPIVARSYDGEMPLSRFQDRLDA